MPQTSINNPLNPSGVGLVNFFGESQSRLYPHMRAKFGRGPTFVSKKGSLKFISRPRLNTFFYFIFGSNFVGFSLYEELYYFSHCNLNLIIQGMLLIS